MTRPCRFCGSVTGRRECVEGFDRCQGCLDRIKPPDVPQAILESARGITVGVGLVKRGGIYVVAKPDGEERADTIAIGSAVED